MDLTAASSLVTVGSVLRYKAERVLEEVQRCDGYRVDRVGRRSVGRRGKG